MRTAGVLAESVFAAEVWHRNGAFMLPWEPATPFFGQQQAQPVIFLIGQLGADFVGGRSGVVGQAQAIAPTLS